MSKYYVRLVLEVRKVGEDEAIKTQGILLETADTLTASPVVFINKTLRKQASKVAEITVREL